MCSFLVRDVAHFKPLLLAFFTKGTSQTHEQTPLFVVEQLGENPGWTWSIVRLER